MAGNDTYNVTTSGEICSLKGNKHNAKQGDQEKAMTTRSSVTVCETGTGAVGTQIVGIDEVYKIAGRYRVAHGGNGNQTKYQGRKERPRSGAFWHTTRTSVHLKVPGPGAGPGFS